MFKLDNALLEELGLGALPAEDKNKMLAHIYETLEMRVGMRLAEQMSNEQLDEFESFIDGDADYAVGKLDALRPGWRESESFQKQLSEAQSKGASEQSVVKEFGALTWLETNFPSYKQVVAEELDKLKAEIKASAPQIVAASQQPPQASPQQ